MPAERKRPGQRKRREEVEADCEVDQNRPVGGDQRPERDSEHGHQYERRPSFGACQVSAPSQTLAATRAANCRRQRG